MRAHVLIGMPPLLIGAMGAVGECYHGSDPVWYSEFRQNSMVRSDGISLRDSHMAPSGEGGACAAFGGPWIRWSVRVAVQLLSPAAFRGLACPASAHQLTIGAPSHRQVIRANSMSGISQASLNESARTGAAPACAGVSVFSSGYVYPPKGGSESTSDVVAEQNVFGKPSPVF